MRKTHLIFSPTYGHLYRLLFLFQPRNFVDAKEKNSSDGNCTQYIRRRWFLSTQGNDRTSRTTRSQNTQIVILISRFIIEIFINRQLLLISYHL